MADLPTRARFAVKNDGGDYPWDMSNIKYNDHGEPISGYVENGLWAWAVDGDEETATDDQGFVRNRWPRREYIVVPHPVQRPSRKRRKPNWDEDDTPF